MSKAFTKESDDREERLAVPRPASSLPSGAKNYLTPGGAQRLREELERLLQVERPRISASAEPGQGSPQLYALNQRIQYLEQSLQSAEIVPPPAGPEDRVRFGATVRVRQQGGEETLYRIVGVDETDLDRNWVSWLSPIAKTLLNARLGQRVRFKSPSGEEELEIVRIDYE